MTQPSDAQSEFARVATTLERNFGVQQAKMFGMPSLKFESKAFAGLFQNSMVFKLAGDEHAAALALAGAHLFDPMGGRPMNAWVVVPFERRDAWQTLAEQALEALSTS